MDTRLISALRNIGVDVDSAMNRFMNNSGLYEKFLLKFLDDENFSKIFPALSQDDFETALNAAHTLKGISGNLGMMELFDLCSEMVSSIRGNNYDNAKSIFEPLKSAYTKIYDVISEAVK